MPKTYSKEPGVHFEKVVKPQRRKLKLPGLSPAARKEALSEVVRGLPAISSTHHGEVLAPEPATVDEFADEINRLYSEVQNTFMRIGALLERAEQTLSAEEYQALAERVPLKKAARSQLRQAYRAIEDGVVPRELAKNSGYTTVYAIASLPPDERQQAIEAGIVRPDTRREEVLKFRRELRASRNDGDRLLRLKAEQQRLLADMNRIQSRLAEISEEMQVLESIF